MEIKIGGRSSKDIGVGIVRYNESATAELRVNEIEIGNMDGNVVNYGGRGMYEFTVDMVAFGVKGKEAREKFREKLSEFLYGNFADGYIMQDITSTEFIDGRARLGYVSSVGDISIQPNGRVDVVVSFRTQPYSMAHPVRMDIVNGDEVELESLGTAPSPLFIEIPSVKGDVDITVGGRNFNIHIGDYPLGTLYVDSNNMTVEYSYSGGVVELALGLSGYFPLAGRGDSIVITTTTGSSSIIRYTPRYVI